MESPGDSLKRLEPGILLFYRKMADAGTGRSRMYGGEKQKFI